MFSYAGSLPVSAAWPATPPPTRVSSVRARPASARCRRGSPRPTGRTPRAPTARRGCAAWVSPRGLRLRLAGAFLDDAENAVRRLLDRQLGDVDHGTAK